jgi:hypothetical protein
MIIEVTKTTMAFVGGYLCGILDDYYNTKTKYTMKFYFDMEKGKVDFEYLHKLEIEVNKFCPFITIQTILGRKPEASETK